MALGAAKHLVNRLADRDTARMRIAEARRVELRDVAVRREAGDERARLPVAEVERRHPHVHPRTHRHHGGIFEEVEQPRALNPRALGREVRRKIRGISDQRRNRAPVSLDDVTCAAVVLRDEFERFLGSAPLRTHRRLVPGSDAVFRHADHHRRDRLRFLGRHVVVRHLQLLVVRALTAVVPYTRGPDLVVDPRRDRVLHMLFGPIPRDVVVNESEIEQVNVLGSLGRELGADRLHVIEAFDRVARIAAVLLDGPLAEIHELVAGRHRTEARVGVAVGHRVDQIALGQLCESALVNRWQRRRHELRLGEAHERGGDIGRFLIGEPEIRHRSFGIVMARILQPVEQPGGIRFRSGADEVESDESLDRKVIAARDANLATLVADRVLRNMASHAADTVDELHATSDVSRRSGLPLPPRRDAEQITDDRLDLGVLFQHVLLALGGVDVRAGHVPLIKRRRHARRRPECVGIGDPAGGPFRGRLLGNSGEVRTRLPKIGEAPRVDLVTRVAAVEFDHRACAGDLRRTLNGNLPRMTLDARRLDMLDRLHRRLEELLVLPVVQLLPLVELLFARGRVAGSGEVGCAIEAAVARRAPEIEKRMR